jgi:acetylornithine/succinyldiaminopimelate/putrescine aminotransferase
MGKRLREGIASMNSPLVTEIRGRGLLNAIVIDESLGKNASADGFAWDICVNLAEMGTVLHVMRLITYHEITSQLTALNKKSFNNSCIAIT